MKAAATHRDERLPGAWLLSPVALGSFALVAWNDLWLKRHHPGALSGKLSDVGLCIFLPIFVAAVLEWATYAAGRRADVTRAACAIAALYFAAIKLWPAATHLHVAALGALVPRWHFRAVTDPIDLVCLPAIAIAWWTMRARRPLSAPRPARRP